MMWNCVQTDTPQVNKKGHTISFKLISNKQAGNPPVTVLSPWVASGPLQAEKEETKLDKNGTARARRSSARR